jgi:hypothetical protein
MNEGGVKRRRMWWELRKSGGRRREMQAPLLAGKREVVRGQQYSSFPSPVLDLVAKSPGRVIPRPIPPEASSPPVSPPRQLHVDWRVACLAQRCR